MTTISGGSLTKISPYNYSVEASDLNWKPGYRAEHIEVADGHCHGHKFVYQNDIRGGWIYVQLSYPSRWITVFND